MVKTETDLKIKCLKSDNRGEYINGEFREGLDIGLVLHVQV